MSEVTIPPYEWRNWAGLFGEIFPTASEGWIEQMTRRMLRTLSYEGPTCSMSVTDYRTRMSHLLDSLKALPPGSIKGGGEG